MRNDSAGLPDGFPITDPGSLGAIVRATRRARGLTQAELAMASHTGRRFIGDLERGKATCRLGPALHVLAMLGLDLEARVR